MFMTSNIKKINFYGTCLSDPGYKSLGYAINNSTLIESHEIEELQNGQLIHIQLLIILTIKAQQIKQKLMNLMKKLHC